MSLKNLLSPRYLGNLLLLLAMVCGVATFVEHYFNTEMAKSVVYNTKWFEFLFLVGAVSLVYNIWVFKLYRKEKIPVGLFHAAFVLMIVGAGVTRYHGVDGQIHLREGQVSNVFLSPGKHAPEQHKLPFSLGLDRFEVDYYPGSETPSEYRSSVFVVENDEMVLRAKVYMNHILKYRGYRFFQSSYDKDLKGSILSLNYDPLGMRITYIGYTLMFLGMFWSLFARGSRFQRLYRKLNGKMLLLLVFFLLPLRHGVVKAEVMSPSTVESFSKLWISNNKGRITPMHTQNLQLVQKLTHERKFQGMGASELVLNILVFPDLWKDKKLIYVEHDRLKSRLSVEGNYASYNSFVDASGVYTLMKELSEAYETPVGKQTKYDKELISVTEKVSIFRMLVEGSFLTIYPTGRMGNWMNPYFTVEVTPELERVNAALRAAVMSQRNSELKEAFDHVSQLQEMAAGNILPSESKRDVEIFYNELNVFTRLTPCFATLAILLLVMSISNIAKDRKEGRWFRSFYLLVVLLFLLHTIAIGMRWYISGHAPMSNGYESMLIVSWATLLAGILLARKSPLTLGIAVLMTSATLLVAHINSMNPEITALVPVLNSKWLSIHVATITASYGFLGICALLGIFNVCCLAFGRGMNVTYAVEELTTVSKLLMILGLYLLTIGCFIGAVWANESWGRYWSWDPKETWCLITIFVYAVVVHMNHIPNLRDNVAYNTGAIWSFLSVLMTYFGVNYFLGGMHSYGKDSSDGLPLGSFFCFAILLIINIISVWRENISKKVH